ncbi:MAG: hypothetical protein V2A53_00420 [bacterium]
MKSKVFYFLEDIAQESFIKALTEKICRNVKIDHIVRNASGGKGSVLTELKSFLRDMKGSLLDGFLIVAIDSNCNPYREMRKKIAKIVGENSLTLYALAIPNPHIEKWYMLDASALNKVLGTKKTHPVKRAKCKKGYYKNLFDDAIKESGKVAPLGAPDFAEEIVQEMDLYEAGKNDSSFKHFIGDVESLLKFIRKEEKI